MAATTGQCIWKILFLDETKIHSKKSIWKRANKLIKFLAEAKTESDLPVAETIVKAIKGLVEFEKSLGSATTRALFSHDCNLIKCTIEYLLQIQIEAASSKQTGRTITAKQQNHEDEIPSTKHMPIRSIVSVYHFEHKEIGKILKHL